MKPWLADPDVTLYHGDVLDTLRAMPDESVDCVVTSPPYWGLRDYGIEGQLGLEPTPDLFVARMVEVFREIRRVLAAHGTCWVNLGDSYNGSGRGPTGENGVGHHETRQGFHSPGASAAPGLKPKDLVGIPWRVAFALQADGWWLRSDIVWSKPNPMPESVTDRPTKSHEYVFLLTKQPRYFFDQEAVREPASPSTFERWNGTPERKGSAQVYEVPGRTDFHAERSNGENTMGVPAAGRNIRSVWEIATQPYPEAHFATYPEELVRRCLLAGCPEWVCRVCGKPRERIVEDKTPRTWTDGRSGNVNNPNSPERKAQGMGKFTWGTTSVKETLGWSDCGHNAYRPGVVLDPFIGSGTTAHVARKHGRHAVGIDLNADYLALAARRLQQQSLFAEPAA